MSQRKIKYSILSQNIFQNRNLSEFIKDTFQLTELEYNRGAKKKIDRFIKSHDLKYKKECHFKQHEFQIKNKEWLERELCLEVHTEQVEAQADTEMNQVVPIVGVPKEAMTVPEKRPKKLFKRVVRSSLKDNGIKRKVNGVTASVKRLKPFEECSRRTKKIRCENIRSKISDMQINDVFMNNLKKTDRKEDAKIIAKLRNASPDRKAKILQLLNEDDEIIPYSANEALAMIVDGCLSTHQYETIQQQAKLRNANIYPPYYRILEAKKMCYPPEGSISISATGVNIDLQSLLDHTAIRFVNSFEDGRFQNCNELMFLYKWGIDGASGQSQYKQIFLSADADGESTDDKSIVMISLVPLQIQCGSIILWRNPHPSSTSLCRPILFEFTKESKETVLKLVELIKEQIKALKPTKITWNINELHAKHHLELTMIDGKVVNYLTDTSNSNCNICGAKPSQMNNFSALKKLTNNTDNYSFGLSTLHCWIRFLECLLHIAYRDEILRTDARGKENQIKLQRRKTEIQDEFKAETGLLLDFVKPGSSGTTNDGNTARRFFKDPKMSAEITGLEEDLINRFRVILITLSSGRDIDTAKFEEYASQTADVYESHYSWYKMPPSVHKILFHGADVIKSLNLPIGLYSEEAQEARNKDFKRIREHNTRKTSRIDTNEDIIHGLLISSDPIISSLRRPFKKPKHELDDEVEKLLKI